MYWLSYGGGINSTALAVLLSQGKLPKYEPWQPIFADTGCERQDTYTYLDRVFIPWLESHGKKLIITKAPDTVIERWEKYRVTGNIFNRMCTRTSKIVPVNKIVDGGYQLIGYAADEAHRAKKRDNYFYPLVEMNIDRQDCKQIIEAVGLCLPGKSSCWCCPFLRVAEIFNLLNNYPDKVERLIRLEQLALMRDGKIHTQFRDKPISYWIKRAKQEKAQMIMFSALEEQAPCECWT